MSPFFVVPRRRRSRRRRGGTNPLAPESSKRSDRIDGGEEEDSYGVREGFW